MIATRLHHLQCGLSHAAFQVRSRNLQIHLQYLKAFAQSVISLHCLTTISSAAEESQQQTHAICFHLHAFTFSPPYSKQRTVLHTSICLIAIV